MFGDMNTPTRSAPLGTVKRFGRWPRNKFQHDPDTGEWHRILYREGRKRVLLDARARSHRQTEELEAKQLRHQLMWRGLKQIVLPIAIIALLLVFLIATVHTEIAQRVRYAVFEGQHAYLWGYFVALPIAFVIACAIIIYPLMGLSNIASGLWLEFPYQLGFQWIKGAKVLDPEPDRPGIKEVEEQKAHGDARVATEAEAIDMLTTREGASGATAKTRPIYLGLYRDLESQKTGKELPYDGDRHLVLFGPNGSGKTKRILVPNLLRLEGRSLLVIDPKGELTAITAGYRRSIGDVLVLNPFDVLGLGSAGFNPLVALDPDSRTFVDDAAGLGEALIKIEGTDPHWSESAQALVVALLMWEVKLARHAGRVPHLGNVRALLTEPDEYELDAKGKRRPIKGLRVTADRMCAQGGPEIESLVGRFLRATDEMASVQSTADTQTRWLLSRPIADNLARNDIDFADLKRRPMTVYLILPAERMRTHSIWLRLIVVSALRALYTMGGTPTLFILDEFAQLGHLGPVEDAFGLVRGYGVQIWPILQDLNQLKALYKDRWETFLGNAGVVQGFAPNDRTTAEWMSWRAGDTTVTSLGYNEGGGQSTGGQGSTSSSAGRNYSQARRPLFLPQEIMDFPPGAGL